MRPFSSSVLLSVAAVLAILVVGCSATTAVRPVTVLERSVRGAPAPSPSPELVVTLPALSAIAAVDPASLTIKNIFDVGDQITGVLIDPNRPLAYLESHSGTSLIIFNVAGNRLAGTISVPDTVGGGATAGRGDRIYAAGGFSSNFVSEISTVQKAVVKTIDVGASTSGIAYSAAFHRLYVGEPDTNSIAVIDTVTGIQRKSIAAGKCRQQNNCDPISLVASSDGLYVLAGTRQQTIIAIDASTDSIISKEEVGLHHCCRPAAFFLGTDPATNEAVVVVRGCCNQEAYSVSLEPPFTLGQQLGRAGDRTRFLGAAFDPTTGDLYLMQANQKNGGTILGPNRKLVLGTLPSGIAFAQ